MAFTETARIRAHRRTVLDNIEAISYRVNLNDLLSQEHIRFTLYYARTTLTGPLYTFPV